LPEPTLQLSTKISDPVHKTVRLSPLESSIIETKIFQRLRNVKQLGLAHYVYPGADFSRFSHSLGVCHVTGRILNELSEKESLGLGSKEIQKYRLSALFHDIGHYPFSHAMEDAIRNYYNKTLYEPIDASSASKKEETQAKPFYSHEALGKRILKLDPEIQTLLQANDFDSDEVSSIFRGEGRKEHRFQNLISSDLDADRIDFLMRTACHTGLPFGNVDIDYLITQMGVDENNKLCLTKKAVKAADHFLLCRHFDRLQVAYHKTVVAMELVLKDVIEALLDKEIINCSREELKKNLSNQDWSYFDDHYILSKIRELKSGPIEDVLKLKVDSILERNPPRLVGKSEEFVDRNDKNIENTIEFAKKLKPEVSKKFEIEEERIYIWQRAKNPITGFGSHMLASQLDGNDPENQEKYEKLIKIKNDDGLGSRPITEIKGSLMNVLAMQNFTSIRFYILFRENEMSKRPDIHNYLKTNLPTFNQES
jgi:uncharacterized protein